MRVVVLSREPQGSAARLVGGLRSAGHEAEILDTFRVTIEIGSERRPHLRYQGHALEQLHAVIPRIGHSSTSHGAKVLRQLELDGVYSPLGADALLASRDKLRALQHLHAAGILVPDTIYVQRRKDLGAAIERLGGAPLIVKVLEGTQGRGVLLAESTLTAEAMAEALLAAGQPVLLQRFVEESRGRDVRAFVVGGEVVAAVRRVATSGEYRSNVHLGAQATPIEPEPAFRRVAVAAAACLGLEIAGVDMLESKAGPMVLEVNSSPGITGIEGATGIDIVGHIVRFLESRVA